MAEKRKWAPPNPAPGEMFMSVKLDTYGSVGSSSDGNLSVSVDATLGDLRNALVELVQTPQFLDKEYQAKLKAITVLCNKDMPMKIGGEEKADDVKLKDFNFTPQSTHFNNMCTDVTTKPLAVELVVFAPVISPEGIKEAEEAQDVPSTVTTDDVKCIGKCGFFGRQSGFCSQCWGMASEKDRRFYSFAFHRMQTKREEALALLAKAEEKQEEERIKKAKVAAAAQEERDKALAERGKKNAERKAAGKCHQLEGGEQLGHNWYVWSREDFGEGNCPFSFQMWTCGLRHAEHHDCAGCAEEEGEGGWAAMHALSEEVGALVKHATEHTEGSEPWRCFWVSKDQQTKDGVTDADNVPQRVRKVLRLPDNVPWAEEERVGWGRVCFWSKEQYRSNANLAKLKTLTKLVKAKCVKDSAFTLSFNPDEQGPCYPVILAALSKAGDHLLCMWAARTWT